MLACKLRLNPNNWEQRFQESQDQCDAETRGQEVVGRKVHAGGEDIGQSQPHKNQIYRAKMRGRPVRLEELVGIRTPNLVIQIVIS